MATSGSVNFNQTRNEIINDAYQLLGVYGVGRTISSEDMNFASNMLNKMIKAWQSKGLHLWAREEAYLFIADQVAEYTLSSDSSSARACARSDAVITELNGAVAASGTSLTVDTTTGMTASDIIGIVLDDDSVDWTTISSVDSSTTLTIASGLTSAASDNNNVYTFTSRINKPLRIHSVRRITGTTNTTTSNQTEVPLVELSHAEYYDLPSKTVDGLPTHYYYNPDLSTGQLNLWPRPNDPEMYIGITYDRMLEDFDASTDNADLPVEWLEALTYQLAVRLAPAFGKEQKVAQLILPMAISMLDDLLDWDTETASLYLMPN